MRDSSYGPTVSYRDQYTLGGLLLYAAVAPVAIAMLSAPQLALAFAGGVFTAVLLNRLHGRASRNSLGVNTNTNTDADTDTDTDAGASADTDVVDSAQTAQR